MAILGPVFALVLLTTIVVFRLGFLRFARSSAAKSMRGITRFTRATTNRSAWPPRRVIS